MQLAQNVLSKDYHNVEASRLFYLISTVRDQEQARL